MAVSLTMQVWHHLSKEVLQPDDPFPLHQLLYQAAYSAWRPADQVRGRFELHVSCTATPSKQTLLSCDVSRGRPQRGSPRPRALPIPTWPH